MNKNIKIENKNFIRLDQEETRILLPQIMDKSIPLMRKKKDGTFSYIPPEDFDQYLKETKIDLYIENENYLTYKDLKFENTGAGSIEPAVTETEIIQIKKSDNTFKSKLASAGNMDMMERMQSVINSNYTLKKRIDNKSRYDDDLACEVAESFTNILCISKVTLEENITSPVSEDQLIKLINETEYAVDNLITLLTNGKSSYADLARLEFIKTGSSTLNHMNRMLIRVVSFLFFYNEYFSKYSNDIKRIRGHFREKFHPLYARLFSDPQNINLEIVFKGGISPIDSRKVFLEYALGGFFHDIGKIPAMEYHDGEEGFVPLKARRQLSWKCVSVISR